MRPRWVLPAFLVILASCSPGSSSGSDGSDPYVPPDPLPVVQATTPSSLAVGVAASQVITARFSESMQASSLTSSSVVVATTTGPVAGTVSTSPDLREARFTPAAPLAVNKAYTVTLTTAIRSSSGQAMASAYAWTFATGFNWAWSPPELLENIPANSVSSESGPEIALDPLENAAAVWGQNDGTGTLRVYAARAPAGGGWESPVVINDGLGTMSPSIDFAAPGELAAVWGNGTQIWASRASMTGAWSAPELAGTTPGWPVIILKMFADPGGNIVVFYHENRDGQVYDDVYVIRYDPLNGWLPREDIPAHHGDKPAFASDDSGVVVALWTPYGATNSVIARRFTPSSGWSADETVSAYEAGRPVAGLYATLDGAGNILAVWWRRVAGGQANERQFYISRRGTGSPWAIPEPVPTGGEVYVNFPAAALAPDGSAVVTWTFFSSECWAVHQDSDGDWGAPEVVDGGGGPYLIPSTGIPFYSGFGRFGILGKQTVYDEFGPELGILWVNQHHPVTGFGSPSVLHTSNEIWNLSLTRDGLGRAAAIWQAVDGFMNVASTRFR